LKDARHLLSSKNSAMPREPFAGGVPLLLGVTGIHGVMVSGRTGATGVWKLSDDFNTRRHIVASHRATPNRPGRPW
jgi:hypothetical protein